MNFSFFLSFATRRMRSSACDTLIWPCVPHVLCWPAFLLVSALGSTGSATNSSAVDCSAAECSALFVGFTATMASWTSRARASSAMAPRLPDADHPSHSTLTASHEISQLPTRSFCA